MGHFELWDPYHHTGSTRHAGFSGLRPRNAFMTSEAVRYSTKAPRPFLCPVCTCMLELYEDIVFNYPDDITQCE